MGRSRELADRLEQGSERVCLVGGDLPLEHCGHAFEAHPGVDRRRRQRLEFTAGLPVELHEDVVPDLDVAIAVAFEAAARATRGFLRTRQGCAPEVVDLGTAAARAGLTHRPEVVIRAELADMIRRQEGAPDVVGLVIPRHARLTAEHGRKQSIRGQLPLVGQQRPCEGNRLALEVVAKREVAQHLEEGVVPERRPDVLEVVVLAADAHALLRGRRTRVVARVPAKEDVLELVHPGIGEEERRIVVRHQRRAGDDAMAVPFEIPEKGRADVRRGHALYCTCRRRSARTRSDSKP